MLTNEHPLPKNTNKRPLVRIILLIFVITLGVGIFMGVKQCTSDLSPDVVNLAVKKDGKTYVYSNLGSFIVKSQIDQEQRPTYIANTYLYKDKGLFVDPTNIKDLVNVFADNLVYFNLKDKSVDGFVTSDTLEVYQLNIESQSTEKIGEQLMMYRLELKHSKKTMSISWSYNTKTFEYKALKNCELHSFYSQSSPYPGKTVTSSSELIVIPMNKVASFFNRKYNYDLEQKVLFIE